MLKEYSASFVLILMLKSVSRLFQPTSEGESMVQIIPHTVKSHAGILLSQHDSSEFG